MKLRDRAPRASGLGLTHPDFPSLDVEAQQHCIALIGLYITFPRRLHNERTKVHIALHITFLYLSIGCVFDVVTQQPGIEFVQRCKNRAGPVRRKPDSLLLCFLAGDFHATFKLTPAERTHEHVQNSQRPLTHTRTDITHDAS